MADDEDDEPTVTLGAQQAVEGAPLARVSARLMWGIEKSAIVEREGETVIRTPSGPQELADLLDAVDKTYFATRQEFETAVDGVIGDGPIPTESADEAVEGDEEEPGPETDTKLAEDEETAETDEASTDDETAEDDETDAEGEETSEDNSESEPAEGVAGEDSKLDDDDGEEVTDESDADSA
jgi:hypothetical protein